MRGLATGLGLLSLLAGGAAPAEAPAVVTDTGERGPHIQLSGAVLGDFLGKSIGGEVRASIAAARIFDLGLGVLIGPSPGLLITGRFHTPHSPTGVLRPFGQLRVALHPVSGGYGGGLYGGALLDVGPGRIELGVGAHLYAPAAGYLPYSVFAMAGYELDVFGARGKALPSEPIAKTEQPQRPPPPADNPPVKEVSPPSQEPASATAIRGSVHDFEDRPLNATVKLSGPTLSAPLVSVGPAFVFPVAEGEYTLSAEASGYLLRGAKVTLKRGEQLVFDLALREIPKQKVAELTARRVVINQSIQFESRAARILPESFYVLDAVVDILLRNPQVKQMRVEGHTDNVGGAAFNLNLSEDRAQSIMQYLIEKGVEPSRLTGEGFGLTKPIADNKTEAGRARNRRVQFEIVE